MLDRIVDGMSTARVYVVVCVCVHILIRNLFRNYRNVCWEFKYFFFMFTYQIGRRCHTHFIADTVPA